jgi:hypothetical protein
MSTGSCFDQLPVHECHNEGLTQGFEDDADNGLGDFEEDEEDT